MDTLNTPQSAAVRYIDGPLLVLAGAGSGKTRVITQKIAYLVRDCGLAARHIAAVTFTNKAAREMQQRLARLLRGKEARGLKVSTFHTLGLHIIRREAAALGYRTGVSVYDAKDSLQLIRELTHKDEETATERIQWLISNWKSALVTPAEALAEASDSATIAAANAYEIYEQQLKAYNALDFDDLILLPLRLFQSQPQILESWQRRIRYLLVDEYQDTNTCQYQLVKTLVGNRAALTVVGDDDQSIYAWRGAQPQNLRLLQEDFPPLKIIKLEQNYRSVRRILKVANRLISHNPHVFEKKLWSDLGQGDPIKVIVCKHEEHEAERVVAELIHHRFKHRTRYSDYAVLYRGNHQSQIFEQRLREHGISYRLSGGTSFFAYTEVKDILAYLRLLVNPTDDAAFLRIANTPRREIGPTSLAKLTEYAHQRGISLLAACFEVGLCQYLGERAHQRLHRFAQWLSDTADKARRDDPAATARAMVADIGYESWLKNNSASAKTAERRIANVHELLDWLERMGDDADGESTLEDRVARMTLLDILERNEEAKELDAVSLMTLHAAKGLEFPHVFMIAMEEEILPHRNSLNSGDIDEERRLAYVGVTRAQRTLTFTLARRRKRYGEWQECEPSRFLTELPEEDLIWEGENRSPAPEHRQERGRAHLAVLRDMLATAKR